MTTSPFCSSVLMCHAPIVIPAVGGARGADCAATTAAMRRAAAHIAAAGCDGLILVSPHTPRPRGGYAVLATSGEDDFAQFGAPDTRVSWQVHEGVRDAVVDDGAVPIAPEGLDHGAFVPMWFLQEAGVQVPMLILGFAAGTTRADNLAMGRSVAAACCEAGGRWGLVASGDMSHRLLHGAPAGYDPQAFRFDEAVCEVVETKALGAVSAIDPRLRDLAAEDVIDSLEFAEGALGGQGEQRETLSYEGPFGVGYLVAVLHGERT